MSSFWLESCGFSFSVTQFGHVHSLRALLSWQKSIPPILYWYKWGHLGLQEACLVSLLQLCQLGSTSSRSEAIVCCISTSYWTHEFFWCSVLEYEVVLIFPWHSPWLFHFPFHIVLEGSLLLDYIPQVCTAMLPQFSSLCHIATILNMQTL